MEPREPGRYRLKRISWRVPLACLIYVLPRLLNLPEQSAQTIRDAAMALIIASFASWLATQGKRRPLGPPPNAP